MNRVSRRRFCLLLDVVVVIWNSYLSIYSISGQLTVHHTLTPHILKAGYVAYPQTHFSPILPHLQQSCDCKIIYSPNSLSTRYHLACWSQDEKRASCCCDDHCESLRIIVIPDQKADLQAQHIETTVITAKTELHEMPDDDSMAEFAMPSTLDASWEAQNLISNSSIPQQHEEHADSTDEDDDGGVAIPSNNTHSPLMSPENIPPEPSSAHQQAEATPVAALTAMSQLSQQLAQIQEAQGAILEAGMLGHIGSVYNNSTTPTLPFHSAPLYFDYYEEEIHTSSDNASIPIAASPTAIANSQMYPPPMAEMHNATAAGFWHPVNGVLVQDLEWDDDANMVSVDVDQNSYTLSMYDFLWTWGHRSRTPLSGRKKAQGPNLASLQRQRIATPKHVRVSLFSEEIFPERG